MASPADDDESSGGDIPSRKQHKKGKKQDEKQLQSELDQAVGDDEDMSEEEYVVEKVIKHKFNPSGTLLLWIKWQGFETKDNTWEPEDNLDGAPDELAAYYKEIGGKPVYGAKKRKLSQPAVDTPSPAGGKGRASKKPKAEEPPKAAAKDPPFKAPGGSWEDEVNSIDTMERGEDGTLYAFVFFKTGMRARYTTAVVNRKCPQKMLEFYEEHLYIPPTDSSSAQQRLIEHGRQFNDTTTKTVAGEAELTERTKTAVPPPATNGAPKEDDEDEVMDEEEELNVKGVATAIE